MLCCEVREDVIVLPTVTLLGRESIIPKKSSIERLTALLFITAIITIEPEVAEFSDS